MDVLNYDTVSEEETYTFEELFEHIKKEYNRDVRTKENTKLVENLVEELTTYAYNKNYLRTFVLANIYKNTIFRGYTAKICVNNPTMPKKIYLKLERLDTNNYCDLKKLYYKNLKSRCVINDYLRNNGYKPDMVIDEIQEILTINFADNIRHIAKANAINYPDNERWNKIISDVENGVVFKEFINYCKNGYF